MRKVYSFYFYIESIGFAEKAHLSKRFMFSSEAMGVEGLAVALAYCGRVKLCILPRQ